jgi:hypothetical protein
MAAVDKPRNIDYKGKTDLVTEYAASFFLSSPKMNPWLETLTPLFFWLFVSSKLPLLLDVYPKPYWRILGVSWLLMSVCVGSSGPDIMQVSVVVWDMWMVVVTAQIVILSLQFLRF